MSAEEIEKLNDFMCYEDLHTIDELIKTYTTLLNFAVHMQNQIEILCDRGIVQ